MFNLHRCSAEFKLNKQGKQVSLEHEPSGQWPRNTVPLPKLQQNTDTRFPSAARCNQISTKGHVKNPCYCNPPPAPPPPSPRPRSRRQAWPRDYCVQTPGDTEVNVHVMWHVNLQKAVKARIDVKSTEVRDNYILTHWSLPVIPIPRVEWLCILCVVPCGEESTTTTIIITITTIRVRNHSLVRLWWNCVA